MRLLVAVVLLFAISGCKDAAEYKGEHAYSKLFVLTKSKQGDVVVTIDQLGKELSKVVFSSPYQNVVMLNTTYLPYVKALGAQNMIKGIVNKERLGSYYFGSGKGIEKGLEKVRSVGENGVLNIELIASLNPDLIICNSYQKKDLEMFGDVDVLVVNEFWENHPLGRAEWIKVFGVLLGKQAKAKTCFLELKKKYEQQKEVMGMQAQKKTKLYNLSRFSSSYFLPGCQSLVSKLIADAQCEVVCLSETAKSMEISKESVLAICKSSDYLLYFDGSSEEKSVDQVKKDLGITDCFDGKVIYCNTLQTSYFEKSILEPQIVVSDLYQIVHQDQKKTSYFTLLDDGLKSH